jgi:hypothetical protein
LISKHVCIIVQHGLPRSNYLRTKSHPGVEAFEGCAPAMAGRKPRLSAEIGGGGEKPKAGAPSEDCGAEGARIIGAAELGGGCVVHAGFMA